MNGNSVSQAVKRIIHNPELLNEVDDDSLDALSLVLSMYFQEKYRNIWARRLYDDGTD